MDFIAFSDGVICQDYYREDPTNTEDQEPKFARRFKQRKQNATPTQYVRQRVLDIESHTDACFKVDPPQVVFRDFEVGQIYTTQVKVTNVGRKLSTFRILPINPLHRSAFTVKYDIPPTIAPGLQWPVTVIFHPTTESDINCDVSVKTETGYTSFSLMALTRRTVISVDTEEIDFGVVTVGESKKKYVVIRNQGALPGMVSIGGSFQQVSERLHAHPITKTEGQFFQVVPAAGNIALAGFSEKIVELHFAPFEEDDISCNVVFFCGGTEISVNVRGRSTQLPIYAVNPVVDFRWCFFGSRYCSQISLTNTSGVSTSVVPKVPRDLRDVISIDPSIITLQSGSTFPINLIFTPRSNLDTNFECTIELQVKGQTLPSILKVVANLTTREPFVAAPVIDFGSLFVNDQQMNFVEVENQSHLLQKVEFQKVPSNISIEPSVATLLPKENFCFRVFCNPPQAGSFNHPIFLTNEYGDRVPLEIKGIGVKPTLLLSESTIKLPPCVLKGCVSASTVLSNISGETRHFQFTAPTDLVRVSPSSGSLKPGECIAVMIFLLAQVNCVSKPEPIIVPRTSKKKTSVRVGGIANHAANNIPPNPQQDDDQHMALFEDWEVLPECAWGRLKCFQIVCVSSGSTVEELPLSIECTVVAADIVGRVLVCEEATTSTQPKRKVKGEKKSPPSAPPVPSIEVSAPSGTLKIDFGESALGHSQERVCLISNKSPITTILQVCPLNTSSCFTVLKPPRNTLEPDEDESIMVQFRPIEFGSFTEIIRISSTFNDIFIRLTGMCSSTELSIGVGSEGDSSDTSFPSSLHFDPTLKETSSVKNVFFNNMGTFPLDVSLRVDEGFDSPVSTRTFICHPTQFTITPRGKLKASIYFNPHQVGTHVGTVILEAGSVKQSLAVSGRCTECKTFVFYPNDEQVDFRDNIQVSKFKPHCLGLSPDFPVQLQFARGESKNFVVGSVKGGPNVEFIVDKWEESFNALGWSISTTKVTVQSGGESSISVSLGTDDSVGSGVMPYCRFAITVRCPSDPSNDRVIHVCCTGS